MSWRHTQRLWRERIRRRANDDRAINRRVGWIFYFVQANRIASARSGRLITKVGKQVCRMVEQSHAQAGHADGIPARLRCVRVERVHFEAGDKVQERRQGPIAHTVDGRQRRAIVREVHTLKPQRIHLRLERRQILAPVQVRIHQEPIAIQWASGQFIKV